MNEQALSQRRVEVARDVIANQQRIEEKEAETITNRQNIDEPMADIELKKQQEMTVQIVNFTEELKPIVPFTLFDFNHY